MMPRDCMMKYLRISDSNTIIISGGETLVNLTGNGMGGRNQEFALAFLKKYIEDEF